MRVDFKRWSLCTSGLAMMGFASQSRAQIAIDGSLDSDYGAPLATQTINTGFGDNNSSDGVTANGSELDAAYGLVQNGNLNLFLAGNVETNGNHLTIFIADGRPGQSTLNAQGGESNTAALNGSNFSPGFSATYMLDMNCTGGTWYVNSNDLTSPAGPETYVGGFTPYAEGQSATLGRGITVSFDNSNTLGVYADTSGSPADPTAADAVTTGFEFSIPLPLLGSPHDPGTPIKVLADINGGSNTYLSNQFLPGLPAYTQNLGTPTFDFSGTPGQYFSVAVPAPTSVSGTWVATVTGNWGIGTNWSGGIPQSAADIATFGDSGVYTVHLNGNRSVGQLIFNSSNSYTIDAVGGGTLTIDDTGDNSGGLPSITVENGSHTISAPVAFGANMTVDTIAAGALTISGNISGGTLGDGTTGFLIKEGDGALVLSGSNSFTGGISLNAGSVELDTNASALTTNQEIYIGDGAVDNQLATLVIGASGLSIATPIQTNVEQADNDYDRAITATYASGNSTLTGPLILNGSVILGVQSGASLTLSGVISNGNDSSSSVTNDLTANGPGAIVLSNAETYTGSTIVNGGTLTLSSGASIASPAVAVYGGQFDVSGSFTATPTVTVVGTLAFGPAPTRNLAELNIIGGTVTVAPAASHASRTILTVGGLMIGGDIYDGWSGLLDLANNDMIVQAGPNTDLPTITSQLASGFAAGTGYWNGASGIISSSAATDPHHLTTLGVLLNDNGNGGPIYTTFGGQPTGLDDVLVKYTYYGDANLDGVVNGADYQQIDAGFGEQLTGWQNGDFNYDGIVDGSDFSLIDNTFNQLKATGAVPLALLAQLDATTSVPEPAALGMLCVVLAATLGRRRRKNHPGFSTLP